MENKGYLDMRNSLKKMRLAQEGKNYQNNNNVSKDNKQNLKNLSTRELLGKMRNLNEDTLKGLGQDKKTTIDQQIEENKMTQNFEDLGVNIEFTDFEVYENGVFFSGSIDGQILWVYKVSPNEKASGFEVNYNSDFDINNPDNKEIIKRIETYYKSFKKYWLENLVQKLN